MDTSFLDLVYGGLSVLDWLELAGITIVLTLAMMFVRRVFFGRFSALAKRTENKVDDVIAELLHGMRTFFLFVLSFYFAVEFVVSDAPAIPWLLRLVFIGFMLQIGLWGNDIMRMSTSWYLESHTGEAARITAVRAAGLVGKVLLWAVISLLVLDNFGIDVTALIAGLGIGGIAIALAVQNVLADLLAYVSIIADRPFSHGDYLVIGEHSGTVEHIGIKTTRIRSLSGEQIVFSNNDLLNSRVRNYKRMNERRVAFTIGVTYDTDHEQLKAIPAILRVAVEAQENTRFDRAHMKEFGDFSINFELVYYMLVPDYASYMDTRQAVNLEIHGAFTRERVEFAFPTQTIYLEKGA